MNTLIDKFVSLSIIWRYSILLALGLFCAHLIYQNILQSQNIVIKHNENELSQLNKKINRYYRDQKKMQGQQKIFNELDQQLSTFEKILSIFNQDAPERAILDAAVKSKIKAKEIKISKREQDEFGLYYLVNIKMTGDRHNVSKFFSQLLGRKEVAVWEQMEFQHLDDQLSLSLATRYYFEISDEVYE